MTQGHRSAAFTSALLVLVGSKLRKLISEMENAFLHIRSFIIKPYPSFCELWMANPRCCVAAGVPLSRIPGSPGFTWKKAAGLCPVCTDLHQQRVCFLFFF